MELVSQYVHAMQVVIAAGANVRMGMDGVSVGVLSVEMGDRCLEVHSLTPASPSQQSVFVSLATVFTVVFDDWPQEVVQMGWGR